MNKVILACILTITSSAICDAEVAPKRIAQASNSQTVQLNAAPQNSIPTPTPEPEPALRGTLPVSGTASAAPAHTTTTTTETTSTDQAGVKTDSTSTTTTTETGAQANDPMFTQIDTTPSTTNTPIIPLNFNSTTSTLQGAANLTEISVTARNLPKCPLMRDHDKSLKYVEVTVKNDGQNIAVILGNNAHADVTTVNVPTAPASVAEDSDLPRINGKERLAVGVVAAFSFGYCGPLFYEMLTPNQHHKRSLGTAIGRDGSRREVESGHFGVRVIMPGDSTIGWLAFRCPRDQDLKSLVIPVSYTRSAIPAGTVTVPVASGLTN
jgi:hypothetical protein